METGSIPGAFPAYNWDTIINCKHLLCTFKCSREGNVTEWLPGQHGAAPGVGSRRWRRGLQTSCGAPGADLQNLGVPLVCFMEKPTEVNPTPPPFLGGGGSCVFFVEK